MTEETNDHACLVLEELMGDLIGALDETSHVDMEALVAPYGRHAYEKGYALACEGMEMQEMLQLGQSVRNRLLKDLYRHMRQWPEDMALSRMLQASSAFSLYTNQFLYGYEARKKELFTRQSEQQRNQVLNSLPLSVVIYDSEGYCVFANERCLQNNRVSLEELVGKNRNDLADQYNETPDPENTWARVLAGNRVHMRLESFGDEGQSLNEKDFVPLVEPNGDVSGVIAVTYSSVSEKERLYNLQRQFSFVLNSMNSGLLILNSESRVAGFNEKAQEIFGLSAEEVIGTSLNELYATYIDQQDREVVEFLNSLVDRGLPIRDIQRTIKMRDRTLTLRLDGNPILGTGGVAVGYILIFEDMTELLAMREAMMRNEKFALIGQFAAGIAHEIRNPLTTVFGFLQLLAAGSVKHENFANLTRTLLIPELDRANTILSDFLMVSKPTAPQRTVVDTARFFEEVVRLVESEAHLRGVVLEIEEADELPELNLDVQQMKQVFLNLCKNAFDVTPPGGSLRLTAKQLITDNHIRFDVIDEGPGIQADDLSRIFDPFFTTKEHGTGLGLPISHRIIEGHGGKLKVRSAAGAGTTFTILIPVGR
ncbi:ATP-binding protein [Tumebacillus amylolyticus]|nr:ATP-binding protein [Tumebacillus amylolyticus]